MEHGTCKGLSRNLAWRNQLTHHQEVIPRSYTSSFWPVPQRRHRRPPVTQWVEVYMAPPVRWLAPDPRIPISNRYPQTSLLPTHSNGESKRAGSEPAVSRPWLGRASLGWKAWNSVYTRVPNRVMLHEICKQNHFWKLNVGCSSSDKWVTNNLNGRKGLNFEFIPRP